MCISSFTCCNFANVEGNCIENCPQNSNSTEDFVCECLPGYTGGDCSEEIDECSPNPCQNNGNCTDFLNGYNCACDADYTGTNCDANIIDDCDPNPCQNGGDCVDMLSGYNCTCSGGYTGLNCSMSACSDLPCQNDGTCVQGSTGEVSCVCPGGFQGSFCEGKHFHCL